MQTFTFGIYSLAEIKHLDISIDVDEIDMNEHAIVQDLKQILTGNNHTPEGTIIITQVDESHEKNLPILIDEYKKLNIPQLKALPSLFLNIIKKNNFYAITLNRQLTEEEQLSLMNRLNAMQNNLNYEDLMKQDCNLFGDLFTNYHIHANDGQKKIEIGPKEKSARICRYCHKDITTTTFNNVAHTVSEALGNKLIVTNDECDICNDYFGKEVETALIEFVDFFRTFYGIQGKKGKIHHKYGGNYELERKDNNSLNLKVRLTDEEIASLPKDKLDSLELCSHQEVAMQDVYRSLVKYALGILQPEYMKEFKNTIEWLLGSRDVEQLPFVRMEILPNYVEKPKVIVMLRKSCDESLPYAVAEIHIINIRFLLLIPLCDERDKPFLENEYWERFISVFKMYKIITWQIKNFSSKEKKNLVMDVKFQET